VYQDREFTNVQVINWSHYALRIFSGHLRIRTRRPVWSNVSIMTFTLPSLKQHSDDNVIIHKVTTAG